MHHSINGSKGIHNNNNNDDDEEDEDEDENHQYQKQQPQQQPQSSLKITTTTLPHNNTQSLHARQRTLRYTTNDDDDEGDDEGENNDRNGSGTAYINQSKRLDTPFLDNNPFSASAAGGQGLGPGVHNSTWGATTRPSGRGGVYDDGRDGEEVDQHVTHSYVKHHHEEEDEEGEEEVEEEEMSMTKQHSYGRVGRDGSDRELSYQSHQSMTSSYLDTNTSGGNGLQGGTILGPPPRPRPQISTLSAAVRGRVINHHNPNNTSFGTMDTATSGGGYSGGGGSGGGGGGSGGDIIRSRPVLSKTGGGGGGGSQSGGGGRGNDSSLRGRSRSGSCDRGERGSIVSDRGGSVVSDTRGNGSNGSKRSNSVNSRRHGHSNTINNNGNQQPGHQPGGSVGQRGFNRTTGTGIGSGGGSGGGSGINNGTGLPIGLPTDLDEMKRYLNSKAMELEAELATYKQENTALRQLRKQQETTLQEVITYAIISLLTFFFLL